MEIKGEYKIAAPRDKVFAALNDPAILQACIPGCESLEKTSDTEMKAKVRLRIGPVSASFTGKVTLSDIDPPNGYKISGEGQGGVAGFAKGGAVVALRDDGDGTQAVRRILRQVRGHDRRAALGGGCRRSGLGSRTGADRSAAFRCSAARLQALAGHRRRRRRADPDLPGKPLVCNSLDRRQTGLRESRQRPAGAFSRVRVEPTR
jgi:carbon monoxide dehydrogenase subunit G